MTAPQTLTWPPATPFRRFLSLLLDAALFTVLYVLGISFVDPLAGIASLSDGVGVIVYVVLEASLIYGAGWTPGHWVLGIRPVRPGFADDEGTRSSVAHVVDPRVARHERWWTLLFGLVAVGVGLWLLASAGRASGSGENALALAVALAAGLGGCALGVGVLRLQSYALPLGVALYGLLLMQSMDGAAPWAAWAVGVVQALGAAAPTKVAGIAMSDIAAAVSSATATLITAWWLWAVCARILSVRPSQS